MSQRGKRANSIGIENSVPVKRRKGRPPLSVSTAAVVEDPCAAQASGSAWLARPVIDCDRKMSSIYNRSAPEAPAELFRKDLISAMKLPDSEPLNTDEYWVIADQWKQEWERGVQVPVNPDSLPEPVIESLNKNYYKGRQDFKLPKNKYIRITKDENFSHDKNYLSNTPALADSVCSYDLDQLDEAWLKVFNGERAMCGLFPVNEEQFERIFEELEVRCYDKIQAIMKSEEGLGIEFDENVICDVCRSPDSEEANEMVFCDNCNICVHQACYGITTIPSGQWLCRTCSMGQKPDCVLCPNKGGAMKSTRSGQKWAHVSCALWIPEVSIGSVDRMEPITKISSIPQNRWQLVCVLCRERVGACIQCSVKTCKTAYHVTCAFQHGLEMRAIIEDENAEDGVKLRSYCQKHSNTKIRKGANASSSKAATTANKGSGSEVEEEKTVETTASSSTAMTKKPRSRKEMSSEERNQARVQRLQEIESEFDKHVSIKDISCHLMDVDQEGINHIYNYWILKRKSMGNKPLLLPKCDDADVLSQNQEQADVEKMKMFVHLRQDLERVRNLCYMVSRREKLSRSFFKMREQIFHKQVSVLQKSKHGPALDSSVVQAIVEANHGPSIYDVLYSSDTANGGGGIPVRIDVMIDSILGNHLNKTTNKSSKTSKSKDLNGTKDRPKVFNGRNASFYDSLSSESDSKLRRSARHSSATGSSTTTSTDDEASAPLPQKKKTPTRKSSIDQKRRPNLSVGSSADKSSKNKSYSVDSSSEEDLTKSRNLRGKSTKSPRSRTLRLMEKELDHTHLTDESDELVPIKNSSGYSIPTTGKNKRMEQACEIYSDSDSTDKDNKTDHTASDSQQQPLRTKAAMKEFNIEEYMKMQKPQDKMPAKPEKVEKLDKIDKLPEKKVAEKPKEKTGKAAKKPSPTDIVVVPQREAAKKASENLMKTNSALMIQSIASSQSNFDKIKRDSRSDDAEIVTTPKAYPSDTDIRGSTSSRITDKDSDKKEKEPKRIKVLKDLKKPTPKVDTKAEKKAELKKLEEKKQKEQREKDQKELEEKRQKELEERKLEEKRLAEKKIEDKRMAEKKQKEIEEKRLEEKRRKERELDDRKRNAEAADVMAYVPQRQAAKKAAEHIKSGIGKDQQPQAIIPVAEEKPTKASLSSSKKKPDLSGSSTDSSSSSSSSNSSSSSSDTEEEVQKPSKGGKGVTTGAKSKVNKVPPFLDKESKPKTVQSSTSSSDSDSSASECDPTPRLPAKNTSPAKQRTKKQPAVSLKKPVAKKTQEKQLSPRSPRRTSKRGELLSSDGESKTVASDKPRVAEPSKRDLAKLPDKRKSNDVKEVEDAGKKRRPSLRTPVKEKEKEVVEKVDRTSRSRRPSIRVEKEKADKIEKVAEKSDKVEATPVKEPIKPVELPMQSPKETTPIKADKPTDKRTTSPEIIEIRDDSDDGQLLADKIIKDASKKTALDVEKPKELKELDKSIETPPKTASSQSSTISSNTSTSMVSIPNANLVANLAPSSKDNHSASSNSMFDFNEDFMASVLADSLIKEDRKEDTVRETQNLIEKLRSKFKRPNSNSSEVNEKASSHDHFNDLNDLSNLKNSPKVVNDNFAKIATPDSEKKDKLVENKKSPFVNAVNENTSVNRINNLPNTPNNILTNINNNNNIHSPMTKPILSDCMVVEKQQQLLQQQKMQMQNHQSLPSCQKPDDRGLFMGPPASNQTNQINQVNQLNQNQQGFANNEQMINHQVMNMQNQPQNQKWSPKDLQNLQNHNRKMLSPQMDAMHGKRDDLKSLSNLPNIPNLPNLPNIPFGEMNDFANMQPNFNAYNFAEQNSQYTGAVSLFPPSGMNVQVPFPSPGQAMFPPNFASNFASGSNDHNNHNNTHNSLNNSMMLSKVDEFMNFNAANNNFGAAFTSQQQINSFGSELNRQAADALKQQNSESVLQMMQKASQESTQGKFPGSPADKTPKSTGSDSKRSPNKSVRASPRFSNQNYDEPANTTPTHPNKTPNTLQTLKSPSKSPRQAVDPFAKQQPASKSKQPNENSKQKTKRANNQAAAPRGGKGRGRGRGGQRGVQPTSYKNQLMNEYDFMSTGSIQQLVGTVYDFSADDEHPGVENLRAMRDRRKSIELHNKMQRDAPSDSPKFGHKAMRNILAMPPINNHQPQLTPQLTDINPVLPGPVDMRTYSSYDNNDAYNSQLLGAFASNTVDQQLNEIDEEQENALHKALKASSKPEEVEVAQQIEESVDSDTSSFAKVSLSDSRNQLKLKIKGPLAHPDACFQATSIQQNSFEASQILAVPNNMAAGGSSLRRMRKKELLRQYQCNQDGDNPSGYQQVQQSNTLTINTTTNRIVGIPKAVDSMSSIPTKEDYKDYANAEFKKRKKISGSMSRELKQLSAADMFNFMDHDMDRSSMHSNASSSMNNSFPDLDDSMKRRTRMTMQGPQAPTKLKIKIGTDVIETSGVPPKKRATTSSSISAVSAAATPPDYEELKRQSMDFRKLVMEDFSSSKKKHHRTKAEKLEKKEEKRKKKEKKREKKRADAEAASTGTTPKLIIKFGGKSNATSPQNSSNPPQVPPADVDPLTLPTITPIKLKIGRNSQGNGYYNINSEKKDKKRKEKKKKEDPLTAPIAPVVEFVTSTPVRPDLQPPIIDINCMSGITTKKLEVSLERLADLEPSATVSAQEFTKNCEVR